jgi:hypothetical protein
MCLLSAGRLARVSYDLAHSEEPIVKSIERAERLENAKHKSVFCHQLMSDGDEFKDGITHTEPQHMRKNIGDYYSGSIFNWVQFRKLIWKGLQET